MKKIALLTYFILSVVCLRHAVAQRAETTCGLLDGLYGMGVMPKLEARAVWLTTYGGLDWPSVLSRGGASMRRQQDELCQTLDSLKRMGINTVLFQTRIRGTVVYPSGVEPWDMCLTGTADGDPGYDPLAFAVAECHRRGMELHAWVVTLPIGKWGSIGQRRMSSRHPELVKRIKGEAYLNPECGGTAFYLADLCAEIVSRYDVDGLHLDYLRYPETWNMRGREAEGRRNISRIAESISRRVRAVKPWAKVSCSPIGKQDDLPRQSSRGWNARSRVCQDAALWLNNGTMSQLYPMMYFRGRNFYPFAFDWQQSSAGRTVAAGIGVYQLSPDQQDWTLGEITRQMDVSRAIGLGQCFFRSRFLTDNVKGIKKFLADCFYSVPAMSPPIASAYKPASPGNLGVSHCGDTLYIEWSAPANASTYPGAEMSYTLWGSPQWPVDTGDPHNIVATGLRQQRVALGKAPNWHYAVTATDRYGTESEAACWQNQSIGGDGSAVRHGHAAVSQPQVRVAIQPCGHKPAQAMLFADGGKVVLPQEFSVVEKKWLLITNLEGLTVMQSPYAGLTLDVSRLQPGIYRIYSLSRKKKRHYLSLMVVMPDGWQ